MIRRTLTRATIVLLIAAGAMIMVIPLLWMTSGAFKTLAEIGQVPPTWIPATPTLDNFVQVFQQVPFARYLVNSIVVSLIAVVCVTCTSAVGGYALAKFRFPGAGIVFAIFIASLAVPFQTRMISLYEIAVDLHLTNTLAGVILPFVVDAFGIFLVRQFLVTIPDELIQAARVDGAGEIRIFAAIIMPMAMPALATVAILTFLNSWQEFLWPLIVTNDDAARTLPVGLQSFATQYSSNVNLQMAGALLAIAPLVVIFLLFQRRIIEGIATSGLK